MAYYSDLGGGRVVTNQRMPGAVADYGALHELGGILSAIGAGAKDLLGIKPVPTPPKPVGAMKVVVKNVAAPRSSLPGWVVPAGAAAVGGGLLIYLATRRK